MYGYGGNPYMMGGGGGFGQPMMMNPQMLNNMQGFPQQGFPQQQQMMYNNNMGMGGMPPQQQFGYNGGNNMYGNMNNFGYNNNGMGGANQVSPQYDNTNNNNGFQRPGSAVSNNDNSTTNLQRNTSSLGYTYSFNGMDDLTDDNNNNNNNKPNTNNAQKRNTSAGPRKIQPTNTAAPPAAAASKSNDNKAGGAGAAKKKAGRRRKSDGGNQSQLSRQDSSKAIERSYSISGQFFTANRDAGAPTGNNNNRVGTGFNNNNNSTNNNDQRRLSNMPQNNQNNQSMGAMNPYGSMMNLNMNMGQPQNNMMPNMFMQNQMMSGGGMTLNSRGGMMTKQSMPMMGAMNMQQMQPQMMMKRQGQVETDLVEEGQVAALGRKSSQASLQRTPSRVGMYFKNKSAEGKEEEYKMEGDESIASKNRTRDPTLEHPFKSLFLYEEGNSNMRNNKHHFNKSDKNYTENDIELDGRTVRAQKPEDEEVTKYDYSGIALVSQSDDVEVTHEVLEEIRDVFAYGCNASLIMADADCPAAKPTSWFSWYALKTMAVSLFSRFEDAIADKRAEITMSMVLLQDDQSLDLLSDANVEAFQQAQNGGECNYDWKDIVVGESPLFGNVVQDLVYMWLDNAGDFNDTLDNALAVAEHYNTQGMQEDQYLNESEEYGIVLCTVLLKQIKTNSSGDQDIVFSSLFCSGVGNGVVHYNRILDKNPAEPRAVFYSVLHRSVHSCAAFSCSKNNAEIFTFLNTLQRFAKMETRKPKIGSVVNFIAYAESTIPRMEDELKKCEDPRRRAMTTKFLLRLRLMLSDFKAAIENPQEAVARTYL